MANETNKPASLVIKNSRVDGCLLQFTTSHNIIELTRDDVKSLIWYLQMLESGNMSTGAGGRGEFTCLEGQAHEHVEVDTQLVDFHDGRGAVNPAWEG